MMPAIRTGSVLIGARVPRSSSNSDQKATRTISKIAFIYRIAIGLLKLTAFPATRGAGQFPP
jgi:hypothetical protein